MHTSRQVLERAIRNAVNTKVSSTLETFLDAEPPAIYAQQEAAGPNRCQVAWSRAVRELAEQPGAFSDVGQLLIQVGSSPANPFRMREERSLFDGIKAIFGKGEQDQRLMLSYYSDPKLEEWVELTLVLWHSGRSAQ